jgi:hypothetical protein
MIVVYAFLESTHMPSSSMRCSICCHPTVSIYAIVEKISVLLLILAFMLPHFNDAFNPLPKHLTLSLPLSSTFRMNRTNKISLFETTFPEYSSVSPTFPWGPKQEWALRENVSKYTVFLLHPTPPLKQSGTQQTVEIILWKSMLREVTELSGYDITMLQGQYQSWISSSNQNTSVRSEILIPYLDQYEFQTHGGVSGLVYGMSGILDGTRIETSLLIQPEYTIPRGYIQTQDEYMAFELGLPVGDGKEKPWITWTTSALESGIQGSKAVLETSSSMSSWVKPLTVTFLTLTGATTLVNLLSHHLTVNVFWV